MITVLRLAHRKGAGYSLGIGLVLLSVTTFPVIDTSAVCHNVLVTAHSAVVLVVEVYYRVR